MAKKEDAIYMHFRPEEHAFVDRCFDWMDQATRRSFHVLTPFLDPREQSILRMMVRRDSDLTVHFDGGWDEAERKRAIITPDYIAVNEEDFGLSYLRIETVTSQKLNHPDVLGALIGAGMKREKIGDINIHGKCCDIIIASELCDYVHLQVGQIGRQRVTIMDIVRGELVRSDLKVTSRTVSVASLRVDALVSEVFRISRTKASTLIKNNKCKRNWKTIDKPDEFVEPGDLISLRGFGRIRVESLEGISKKGRKWIKVITYKR